jgi:hypothetical protein
LKPQEALGSPILASFARVGLVFPSLFIKGEPADVCPSFTLSSLGTVYSGYMDRIPFDPYDFFGYLASGLLIVVGMQLVLGFPLVLGQELKVVDSAFVLLAIYVAGQIIATPAKAFLEDLVVDKILRRPSVNLLRARRPPIRGILFPSFYKPLPGPIRRKLLERKTVEGIEGTDESFFLQVRYKPELLENERLSRKLDSFISKYGFSRNLSFSSLVVGCALLWKAFSGHNPQTLKYSITALSASLLLFYRYLKFLRQYSYELFNAYVGGR